MPSASAARSSSTPHQQSAQLLATICQRGVGWDRAFHSWWPLLEQGVPCGWLVHVLRYSHPSSRGPARTSAVLGVQGIAPYWFDVEAALFISHEGEVSARVELEYDLLLTQRLILQPRLETNLGAQNVRELGMNAGVSDIEIGARLRYEIRRELAPYIGVLWSRRFGEAASATKREGGDPDTVNFVVGIRLWFWRFRGLAWPSERLCAARSLLSRARTANARNQSKRSKMLEPLEALRLAQPDT